MTKPSLFGIKHSNRDFTEKDSWSKNNFNSSFPAGLIAYMDSQGIPCVYLRLDDNGELVKDYITGKDLFHLSPVDDNLFYSFESAFTPYQPYSIGSPPRVDLMLMNNDTSQILAGYEVKLTTLPDESTFKFLEDKWGCELVIRMPSIHFLASSIAAMYKDNHEDLRKYFGKNGFGNVGSYSEAAQVNPRLGDIWERMSALVKDNSTFQKPALIQPIWKTLGKSSTLAENCLDVFVWSDLAFTKLFMSEAVSAPKDLTSAITRPTRALIQLFFMLNDVAIKGTFHHNEILQKLTYTMKNDKAFSVPGRKTNRLMLSDELLKPRITKNEIKNIILGDGQLLLSPERRFDAALVSALNLFN